MQMEKRIWGQVHYTPTFPSSYTAHLDTTTLSQQPFPMNDIMRFPSAVRLDPAVDAWFVTHDELRRLAQPWFQRIRDCGPDVRELLHDGCPTACVTDAAFAYVNAFKAHVNIGFFHGAALPDPAGLLVGTGKRMRHVKLHWGQPLNDQALTGLISAAYADTRKRSSGPFQSGV